MIELSESVHEEIFVDEITMNYDCCRRKITIDSPNAIDDMSLSDFFAEMDIPPEDIMEAFKEMWPNYETMHKGR